MNPKNRFDNASNRNIYKLLKFKQRVAGYKEKRNVKITLNIKMR